MPFLGTHPVRLDEKGRLFLPAKYRGELAGGVVITKGQNHCLFVFTRAEFDGILAGLRGAPLDVVRMLTAGASEQDPDKQGRVTIPQRLREYANLQREASVNGAGTRLEIWDAQAWQAYEAAQEEPFSAASEEVLRSVL